MNEQPDALDQADEEILTAVVSDEALEAAADTEDGMGVTTPVTCFSLVLAGCCSN
jgi:hypothetical protein